MKCVILAGGLGTRLSEETVVKPKPMVEIGHRPILWHIMKLYAHHGVSDFIVCCGYKGYVIKEYFANYLLHNSDVTFDTYTQRMEIHRRGAESWRVTLVDTGYETQTGGRLRRVAGHLGGEQAFCFTYGDGVGDVDIAGSIAYHRAHGRLATLTAVYPPARFGALEIDDCGRVSAFREKPLGQGGMINGGFFVLSPKVLDLVADDACIWEREPLERLAAAGELQAWRHEGFWQPMDTVRDKLQLQALWNSGRAPWKVW
jgi:glucose-1-phosphate cytidylyltransferase